jgi:hypothetical protein
MGITTWLDRITDETNVWLSAVKAEEGGDFGSAAVLYLDDAAACLKRNSTIRAGLSAYCAADCLARAGGGEMAKRLFLEAGVLYSEKAEDKLSDSIRESMWALQRAYACFVQAGDAKEAERVKEELSVLAMRANPFVGVPDGFKLLAPRRRDLSAGKGWSSTVSDTALRAALDRFVILRRRRSQVRPSKPPARRVEEPFGQEGIVSQLG